MFQQLDNDSPVDIAPDVPHLSVLTFAPRTSPPGIIHINITVSIKTPAAADPLYVVVVVVVVVAVVEIVCVSDQSSLHHPSLHSTHHLHRHFTATARWEM